MVRPKKEKTAHQIAKKAYPVSYMNQVCKRIGIQGKEKETFCKRIRHSGERYLILTKINSDRITPTEQKRLLNRYKNSLKESLANYKMINKYSTTSAKLGKATRKKYEGALESGMKEMFEPYFNSTSMAPTLFENFLFLLAEAAENAKSENVGNDKADLSGVFLTEWVASVAKCWPSDATIGFVTGSYYKESKIYKSECISILKELICRVEPRISRKNIETAVRKVKSTNLLNKPIANFFVA
jgi:hypothetical protein